MELGLTFPLQRFLKLHPPAYGTDPGCRFCWDLHVIRLQGRRCLLAVHCCSRYAFVRYDVSALARRFRNIYSRRGPRRSPAPTAAGRLLFSTGPGQMYWPWIFVWIPAAMPSPCWTTPSILGPAAVRGLRD